MVSSLDRNWVGGLSSGLDTQALIEKMIEAESFPKYSLERKRTTIGYQQQMLQDTNLKLFELQTKATDLTFSKTFNSKIIDASDARIVNAKATTEAAVGSYTVHVKQLATSTSVSSRGKLAESLELGYNLKSTDAMGGSSTTLGALGVTAGDLQMDILAGGSGTYNISTGAGAGTSIKDLVSSVNSSIANKPELKGKINATWDERNNKIKFNLLDSSMKIAVKDSAPSTIIASMFEADGQIDLDKDIPQVRSDLKTVRSGLNTTLADLGITQGTFTIERNGTGIPENFDLSGLPANTSSKDLIAYLNHEIDAKASLVDGGVPTGNPEDRLIEFRFDEAGQKLELVNTNSGDANHFILTDGTGDLSATLFGGATKTADLDPGEKLNAETFPSGITGGVFTIDGVQINVDPLSDDLQGVLSRITALTDIKASYDSDNDILELTRKDGSNTAIGLGSSTDSSNFLDVTGLIAGSQASSAKLESTVSLGKTLLQASTSDINTEFASGAGSMRVTVNGTASDIAYSGTESLNDILDKISNINGIDEAFYDASTGKVNITTDDKGTSAKLQVEDLAAGTLAGSLGLNTGETTGLDMGSKIVSARPISDVKTAVPFDQAGFSVPVTAGNFTINGVSFLVNSTTSMTLDSMIEAINSNEKVGVSAHYDPTNGKFVLTSTETGNRAVALGAATDSSNFLSAMGLVQATQDVGQNAIYNIDDVFGGADQVSQSNSIDDAVEGVTFDFYDTTGASGEIVNVEADVEIAKTAIDEFIASYNEVTELVYSQLTEERNWSLDAPTDAELQSLGGDDLLAYESAFKTGLLSGDSTLRTVRSQLRTVMSSIVPEADALFNSLSDIGITTGAVGSGYQDTMVGTLQITSEDKLTQALKNNPSKIAELFNKDSEENGKMGIARHLKAVLNEFTRSDGLLTQRVGRTGTVNSNSEMDKQISLINEQITAQDTRLSDRQDALMKQFATLETAMSQYQSQSSAFSQQLAGLSG